MTAVLLVLAAVAAVVGTSVWFWRRTREHALEDHAERRRRSVTPR